MCFIGTNRTNATARDNLMTGASLGYSGYYMNTTLRYIGVQGMWWTSTVSNNTHAGHLMVTTDGDIQPQRGGNKYYGRAVRYNKSLISS